MVQTPIHILVPPRRSDLAIELGLPDPSDNVFQRVIRNPHINAPNPRERECTEMLCAVLRNAPAIRGFVLRWLLHLCGDEIDDFDSLDFTIDTEGAIGSKRDDLRIEGWRVLEEERESVLLWTIEVKVGASFHESSALEGVAIDAESAELVSQIVNYDHWLSTQVPSHRAGFVLALVDASHAIPTNLKCPWQCTTWTALGIMLGDLLRQDSLPACDLFLGKHLVGFIKSHLWRASEMSDFEIDFDDVALNRNLNCSNASAYS